ncbi:MAG: adenylosuccinate synthase [Anaerolineaceae bacterium]|nr:adenylosuccinate synthase [Anaerolineaceae bacterium]
MSLNVVVGAQWGDEGKGRIVDMLAAKADVVARFSGGDNAGHTVTVQKKVYKLHLVPSGIVHPQVVCILGNGMVINPLTLLDEMTVLATDGISVSQERLLISHAAHLITPAHRILDRLQEEARGKKAIGTTGRGIGPAYVDKTARRGLRAQDILDAEAFREKMVAHVTTINRQLVEIYQVEPMNVNAVVDEYVQKAVTLAPHVQDTGYLLRGYLSQGKNVLVEGAQGALLDLDHGSYPFVTSSSTTAAGIFSGLGIGVRPVDRIIGVTKVFQTRVGAGPFPTEIFDDTAGHLRGSGVQPWDEFGTTTGRPRRVGWLDMVLLKYAIDVSGISELVLTKLDVLSGLPELRVCVAYKVNGQEYVELPFGAASPQMDVCEPVFEVLPGWGQNLQPVKTWEDLPPEAKTYIAKIEAVSGVPVSLVSTGPERDQYVIRGSTR